MMNILSIGTYRDQYLGTKKTRTRNYERAITKSNHRAADTVPSNYPQYVRTY